MNVEFLKKLAQWNARVVEHADFKMLVQHIEDRMQLATVGAKVESLAILGEAGCGKTSIAEHLKAKYPPYYETTPRGEQLIVPVMYMRMPATGALSHTVEALLDALKISYPKREDVPTLTQSLVNGLKRARTRLVFFDEIQQLNDARGSANVVKNWLKNLIDSAGIPITFLGLPNATHILSGEELNRRVEPKLLIKPFPFPTSTKCSLPITIKVLSDFLMKDIQQTLTEVEAPVPLGQRLWIAGGGRISQMRSIIFNAVLRANKENSEIISLKHFETAYAFSPPETTLIKKGNPFAMPVDKAVSLASEHQQGEML